ncbi:MAG TPA: PilZ domain-containing protein [Candidatus Acidoferrales bacterium]
MASFAKDRRYPRVGLPRGMFVAWQGPGERVVSRVATVGLGGLFIRVSEPPPVGDVIRLYFEVPGGEVRARAVIRNSTEGEGMGVEFTAMEPETRGRLTQLLRRLLRDSADTESAQSVRSPQP